MRTDTIVAQKPEKESKFAWTAFILINTGRVGVLVKR